MKSIMPKVALLLFSVTVIFLVLEVGLRLTGYGIVGERDGNVVLNKVPEFEHTAVLNAHDLRDEEIGPKRPGEIRILALGDSFTFGLGVEEPECFVRVVEGLLRERSRRSGAAADIRVVNAGVGKGPRFQIGWLRDVGLSLEPDLVLHQLFIGNDLYDDLRTRDSGGNQQVGLGAPPGRSRGPKIVLVDWIWSRLLHVPALDRMLFRAGYRYESRGLFLREQPDLEREAWAQTLDGILRNVRSLGERGIDTFVMIVPTSDQVRYGADRPAGQDYRLPNRILGDFLTQHGIGHLDLLPLMEHQPDRGTFYYVRDLHWTPAGHAFAAEALADRLWEEPRPRLRNDEER